MLYLVWNNLNNLLNLIFVKYKIEIIASALFYYYKNCIVIFANCLVKYLASDKIYLIVNTNIINIYMLITPLNGIKIYLRICFQFPTR